MFPSCTHTHSRLQDSDNNASYTSGQSSSSHLLPPIPSSESLDSYSANSLNSSLGRHHLEQEHKAPVAAEETDGLKNDDVFEETRSQETKPKNQHAITTTASLESEERVSCGQLESDEEGANKGDSGIDPGEMFVAPVVSPSDVGGNPRSLSSCSKQHKSQEAKRREQSESVGYITEGDTTPPCHGPPNTHVMFFLGQLQPFETHSERTHPATAVAAPPIFRSPSNDVVQPTTPHRCYSPSAASDVSLYLPNPSTPWAPPPSPLRSNSYRLSSSLPSSPTAQHTKPFRFSMEVQEALFPPFDPSTFSSPPSSFSAGTVNLRSTPKSVSKSKRQSLRHSCGHSVTLPTFPEDRETQDRSLCDHAPWCRETGVVSLGKERFSGCSQVLRRVRSASNPTPLPPPPPQPAHFTLNLARYSPCSSGGRLHPTAGGSPTSLYKYYTIRPCLNCRLSSSEPNLVARLSATHLV